MNRTYIFIFIVAMLTVQLVYAQTPDFMVNDKIISKIKIVNCALDTIWWKWTTHEGLMTFFGNDNKIEMKPEGPYEIYFTSDTSVKERGGEGNKILSYLPKEMISFTWSAPPDQPEIRHHKHKTWVVVHFRSLDGNKTEVQLDHLGWLDGEKWDVAFNYFDKAWDTVLNWLSESCK